MLIQPIEYMAPAVQSFTPPTPIFTVTQSPTIFPSEDIKKTQTTASYSKEPIPELVNSDQGEWTFSLDVPIPKTMVYPTLTSLDYTIKYGTENGSGTSTIQTSVVLTKTRDAILDSIPNRITTNPPSVCINGVGVGIPPQMLGGEPIVCLSSVPAVKDNGYTSQLEHYIDRQQFLPHVRITEDSRLYLQLQVTEAPSPHMLRSLVVDVSAAWAEDMQAKAMFDKIAAAELRTKAAEQKKAEDEQARLQAERKSAEAKHAKDIAEGKEKEAKKKSEDAQEAKKQADQQADADRLAKKQADDLAETHRRAKEVADAAAHSLRNAKHDADRRANAEHKAEVAAETRAEKDREARSAIERQL
jgi:hypothetical protein